MDPPKQVETLPTNRKHIFNEIHKSSTAYTHTANKQSRSSLININKLEYHKRRMGAIARGFGGLIRPFLPLKNVNETFCIEKHFLSVILNRRSAHNFVYTLP